MSRSHDAHDPYSHFDAAAAAYENAAPAASGHDPFGPVGGPAAQPAPVYASPSLVPSADFQAASFDDDQDDLYPSAPKKPTALYAGIGAALLAGALLIGNHFVSESRAEEARLAEIAKVQQTTAELEAKRRAEEANRPKETAPATGSSSVAALLAASTNSYGAAQSPQAQKPNGLAAARQAAAIQRALQGPGVARRGKAAQGGKAPGAARGAAREDDDGLHESHSNDPIYGL